MPKISPQNIAEAIYEATEGKSGASLAETARNSVQMLHRKRMLGKSDEVVKALQNILDKKTGTIRAKITTAKKISPEQRNKIEHEVKEKYKAKQVASEFFEKGKLLGGMRVEVGDEVLDTSYKNKLKQLEDFLTQAK
ncbi:hypothetical protein A3A03_02450 [Candidatus Nomurabacteria bacterium RIFCSPLOWO2_01_FULL_40_18]|uniref:ATP synthase subunit delta n=1 Tax=Candidatus Nomurabacteria bacterium RIFCSPLOWO2_01_FULL_40_18 TaxID=1801773 RepID=A0A1F6XK70_9BACT|nr:MAG: hypothetical protein A3A03_02450 [Candidatus Nomurabacteria bacterium RIFCSPLOWO2_01_FULL_40_18]